MQRKEPLRQIHELKIESPKAALISDVMDSQNRAERQSVRMHEHRHQRRGPVVHVQNLQLRCQSPGQLHRRFAEKNKSRGVIFVWLTALAVNSGAIKKLVTANQKQLDATSALALEVTRR